MTLSDAAAPAQVYTIYSILSLVFVILIIVTAFITIALTYFQLAVEDHGWWWRSFLCGGSTGVRINPLHSAAGCVQHAAHQSWWWYLCLGKRCARRTDLSSASC